LAALAGTANLWTHRPVLVSTPRVTEPSTNRPLAATQPSTSTVSPSYQAGRHVTSTATGWLGATSKVDWPILVNLRLDPFERTGMFNGKDGSMSYYNWFVYQFWRFQFVQKEVAKLAETAIEFPPMQKGASFNFEAVKEQIEKASAARAAK